MKARKLCIHIGMPKTGTSALQEVLYWNREKLAAHGYLYPDFGAAQHQHFPLVRSLAREVGSPAGFPPGGLELPVVEFKQAVDRDVGLNDIHTVILSSEFFFDYAGLTPGRPEFPIEQAIPYLRGVALLLRDKFQEYDASVAVWLRRQDHWLMSMYNNAVKVANYTQDFEVFFKNQVAPWYGRILDQWADAFGLENIKVFIYEKSSEDADVIPQFLRLIGFPEAVELDRPRRHPREGNVGLSRELLVIKREINRAIPDHMPGLRHSIEDLFFRLARKERETGKESSPIISPQRQLEILAQFSSENEHVLQKFLRSSRSSLFTDPGSPSASREWSASEPITGETLLHVLLPLTFSLARRIKALEARLKTESKLDTG